MVKVSASLLAAPPLEMLSSIRQMESAGVDLLHLDIMDGLFVPNISFGMDLVAAVRKATTLPLDVHLMIERPERYFEAFARAGADLLTVHAEAFADPALALAQIRELGMRPGLTLKPGTPVSSVIPYLPSVELLLVMTVEPGFGGQALMSEAAAKIAPLREALDAAGSGALLSVDGGVNLQNAPDLVRMGADVLVMGTALVRAEDPRQVVESIHSA